LQPHSKEQQYQYFFEKELLQLLCGLASLKLLLMVLWLLVVAAAAGHLDYAISIQP
jgi:hypothetical protein